VNRRDFIALLGGAAAAWPLAAVAQVSTKRPLIAWLSLGERTASWAFVEAFLHGMRDFGYTDGDNFEFAPRFADGYIERLPMLAQGLVQLRPSVILAPASGPAVAAKRATATIPIVSPALADAVHLLELRCEASVRVTPLTRPYRVRSISLFLRERHSHIRDNPTPNYRVSTERWNGSG
jgi:putative tryptophan/tyrosine transport system substrate-binding protein